MGHYRATLTILAAVGMTVAAAVAAEVQYGGLEVTITRTGRVHPEPLSGRLLLLLDRADDEPLFGPRGQTPFATRLVSDWTSETPIRLDGDATAFLAPLDRLPTGTYAVRAVLDLDPDDWNATLAPGNLYCSKATVTIQPAVTTDLKLVLEHTIERPEFNATEMIREVQLQSKLVSRHLDEPAWLSAAVILPASYAADSTRTYPTVYVLPGWGGHRIDVTQGDFQQQRYGMTGIGEEKIFVYLDHAFPNGYHCFADSPVAGPWGQALVTELIPHLERAYRMLPQRRGRFLAGQSSGGWGALWLQITYPETFAAAFAGSPDFVDFRAFGHGLDLYAEGANFFTLANGTERPVQRSDGTTIVSARDGWRIEELLGGGQIHSFEAVFSPPDDNGEPRPLFDRTTGAVDPQTAAAWKDFDLSLQLRSRWQELAPLLTGRLFVFVSEHDDYYLDEAVRLLGNELESLGAAATVVLIDGGGHNVWTDDVRRQMHAAIDRLGPPPVTTDTFTTGTR